MTVEILDTKVSLVSVDYKYLDIFIGVFNKYVLCSRDKDLFFSLTINNPEISLIVNWTLSPYFTLLPNATIIDTYRIAKIYEDQELLTHIGIVKSISSIFSDNNIPILYINSYGNNYVLFEDQYLDRVNNVIDDINANK
jgi:hypothetical protein